MVVIAFSKRDTVAEDPIVRIELRLIEALERRHITAKTFALDINRPRQRA